MLRSIATVIVITGLGLALIGLPAQDSAARAQTEDAALLRELAERLLAPPYPGPTGEVARVRLFTGTLPPNLPVDLPSPPDSRLIGSAVRPSFAKGPVGPATGESIEVVLDVPGAARDILAFYQAALTERGWFVPQPGPGPRPGGFLPSAVQTGATFCQSEAGPFVTVNAFTRPSRPTDVRVHIESGFPGPCGGLGGPRPPFPPEAELLPPLEAPAGVQVQPAGGGGGPFYRSSDAIAETEMSVTDLEAHYAAQLVAAGWTRLDGGVEGPLAWSRWTAPGEGERPGLLTVLAGPGADRRTLHVQAALESGQQGAGPGVPVPVATAVPVRQGS